MSYVERPNYEEDNLETFDGYVTELWVEQEDERDQLKFNLYSQEGSQEYEITFNIYLDVGTTVALAQLQLLRDAMLHNLLVTVHFKFDWSSSGSAYYVYYVKIYPSTHSGLFEL